MLHWNNGPLVHKCYDFWMIAVDRRNPSNQLRLVIYPVIYNVLFMPGAAEFLPPTKFSISSYSWKTFYPQHTGFHFISMLSALSWEAWEKLRLTWRRRAVWASNSSLSMKVMPICEKWLMVASVVFFLFDITDSKDTGFCILSISSSVLVFLRAPWSTSGLHGIVVAVAEVWAPWTPLWTVLAGIPPTPLTTMSRVVWLSLL